MRRGDASLRPGSLLSDVPSIASEMTIRCACIPLARAASVLPIVR